MACPSCCQTIKAAPDQFRQHINKCCPDVLPTVPKAAWLDVPEAARVIAAYEARLTHTAKELTYRDKLPRGEVGPMHPLPPRHRMPCNSRSEVQRQWIRWWAMPARSYWQVATRLGASPERVRMILRRASKAIPLVADATPLEVVYEDRQLLVVNKPPGLRFHPVHRFQAGAYTRPLFGSM